MDQPQTERKMVLKNGNTKWFIDIHCHCLAGLDDGPVEMSESIELCRWLLADGINTVIATPHQLGFFDGCNEAEKVRQAVTALNEELIGSDIPLKILPGAEVRIDERICELLSQDKVLTLADNGRYILVEFPHNIFFDMEPLLIDLELMGIRAIISHPEANHPLCKQSAVLSKWLEKLAYLQVDASSLHGDLGLTVQKSAWHLLESGMVSLVATDSHNITTRTPRMRLAFNRIAAKLGEEAARLLCIENPSRLLNGQDLVPVKTPDHREVRQW